MAEEALRIPWPSDVKIHNIRRDSSERVVGITMEKDGIVADLESDGTVYLTVDSRKNIGDYMSLDKDLTRSLRGFLKRSGDSFGEGTLDWLLGTSLREAPPRAAKGGVLDWWPGATPGHRGRIGRQGNYRGGWPSELFESSWIGSRFEFQHFEIPGDDGGYKYSLDEGLAIDWKTGRYRDVSGVEVWVGDVDGFFGRNSEYFDDPEDYGHYNEKFDNAFLWALDEMGAFRPRKVPDWTVKVIRNDPDLLWPDLVERLVPALDQLPEDLDTAVRIWIDRRRKEAERAAGQLYLYPEKKEEEST